MNKGKLFVEIRDGVSIPIGEFDGYYGFGYSGGTVDDYRIDISYRDGKAEYRLLYWVGYDTDARISKKVHDNPGSVVADRLGGGKKTINAVNEFLGIPQPPQDNKES